MEYTWPQVFEAMVLQILSSCESYVRVYGTTGNILAQSLICLIVSNWNKYYYCGSNSVRCLSLIFSIRITSNSSGGVDFLSVGLAVVASCLNMAGTLDRDWLVAKGILGC